MRLRIRPALIVVLLLVLLSVALRGIWMPQVGLFLNVPDEVGKADVILIWPGEHFARMNKAIELYDQGWAPKIVVFSMSDDDFFGTVARLLQSDMTEQQALMRYFERGGIPAGAVDVRAISDRSDIGDVIERDHPKSVILVLDSYYMRRVSRALATRLHNPPVRVYHVSTTPAYYEPAHWWRNRTELKIVFGEYLRLGASSLR